MRKVTYGAACSLDGFIAGPNGEIDWLQYSKDVHAIMKDYWARIDTLLIGRKTWEVANAMGGGSSAEGDTMMAGITFYVFSRTLGHLPAGKGELVSEHAGEFVRDLKRRRGKEICVFGGGELAQSLFDAGVIDEVGLNVHPVLLGTGVPLFRDAGRIKLKLTECRQIAGGCVYMMYRVLPRRQRNLDLRHALDAAVG
ncbi:MAG: dihydrofolate reductase family protein [Gemmatimonadaceae bacterium]